MRRPRIQENRHAPTCSVEGEARWTISDISCRAADAPATSAIASHRTETRFCGRRVNGRPLRRIEMPSAVESGGSRAKHACAGSSSAIAGIPAMCLPIDVRFTRMPLARSSSLDPNDLGFHQRSKGPTSLDDVCNRSRIASTTAAVRSPPRNARGTAGARTLFPAFPACQPSFVGSGVRSRPKLQAYLSSSARALQSLSPTRLTRTPLVAPLLATGHDLDPRRRQIAGREIARATLSTQGCITRSSAKKRAQ